MATEAIEQVPADGTDEQPNDATPKRSKLPLILGLVGILGGAATGALVLGPTLLKRRAEKPKAAAEVSTAAPVVHALENLILNPAGTGGTRFLMVTATFEVRDAGALQNLRDHEAEVRDRILALLGKKTIDELTDMAHRDAIKHEVLDAITPLFPKGSILKLYFPQFVIQ